MIVSKQLCYLYKNKQHRRREIVWPDEESTMEGKVAFHLSLKLFLITIKIYLCKDFKSL